MQKRNSGLDFFRTLAIGLVLMSHSRHLFTYLHFEYFNLWWFSVGGYLGVELFFVLSGFLIADQLYKYVINSSYFKYNLKVFYYKRWLRTLPLYYLLLVVYVIFYHFYKHYDYFPFLHLFFLQNFDNKALHFFAVSWSLSVEEWFYLIIPIILLISYKFFNKKFIPLIVIFVVITLIKSYIVYHYPHLTWTDIRKNIFLRFDSLIVGVFLAYLKNYQKNIFNTLALKKYFYLAMFFLISLIAWYYYKSQIGLDNDFFSKAFMFQITSVSLGVIMIYLYFNFKANHKFYYYGSIYSYSIYLIHFLFLLPFIRLAHLYKNIGFSIALLIVFIFLNVFCAYLIYKYFEKPILSKRPNYII